LGRICQKSKKSRYKWIFGNRKSFIPKKISKMFEFKAKTGAKMTKKKTRLRRKLRKINPNLVFETKKLNSKEELLKKKNFLSQNGSKMAKTKL